MAIISFVIFIHVKPPKFFVVVNDEKLCAELNDSAILNNQKEKYILPEQLFEYKKSILEKNPIVVAQINISHKFNFESDEKHKFMESKKSYHIASDFFATSIECDFSKPEKEIKKITDPNLSVSISSVTNFPKESRALLLNGKYIDDENYGLEKKIYADVLYLNKNLKIKNTIENFLDSFFAKKNNPPSPKTIFVASVGDIMLARGVEKNLTKNEDGIKNVFKTTLPILQKNNITIGNLEGVLTNSTKNQTKTYTFKFDKKVLEPLRKAGFTYLMQTNNHCYDYGEAGFLDTLDALNETNFPSSGIGKNIEEAKKFYHTEIDGQKFAIISCGAYPVERSGFNGKTTATETETRAGILWQSDDLLESVKREKENGNIVIVNVHGGEEYHFKPNATQQKFYESLIDNGASVVFGSHPHVLQPTKWHNDGLIVYSLGNFVFPGMEEMPGGTDSEIVRLGFVDGKIIYAEQYPCVLKGTSVELK